MECKICGVPSHGSHFGALTCRACAVFFKRAILAKRFRKSCKFDKKCTNFTSSPSCKSCRMQKCLRVGMSSDNIRQSSIPVQLIQPTFPKKTHRNYIDLNFFIFQAAKILKSGCPTPWNPEMSQLEKMTFGSLKPPGISKKLDYFDENNWIRTTEFEFLSAAKWLSCFDKFMELPTGMQMQLLQMVWHIWARVNRLIRTAQVWKNKPHGLKVLQFCNDYYMEVDNTVFDMSWIANCSFQELMSLFSWDGLSAEMEQMIATLSKLCLTEVEITFMTAQLSFQYAASRFPDTEICDRFQEILANDLHNYYKSNKVKSYAGRLAQMMKLNQGIQKSIRMVRDKVQIARMFDVFILDFSHPEMFIDTGCGA